MPLASPSTSATPGRRRWRNGATGTNTQEAEVDEPDVAKTDGRLVVRLQDGRRLVVTDVTGDEPRELADWRAARHGVRRRPAARRRPRAPRQPRHQVDGLARAPSSPEQRGTEVYDVDLSDPADPRLDGHRPWSGRQLSMRQYGDTVRLVTTIGLPALPFVQPGPATLSEAEAEQRNREIVRASRIEDWIPGLDCGEVYHPDRSGPAPGRPSPSPPSGRLARRRDQGGRHRRGQRGVLLGRPALRHLDRLDLGPDPAGADPTRPRSPTSSGPRDARPARTSTPSPSTATDTRYVASGVVDGTVRDRWSLDEHDGHLRVAVVVARPAGQHPRQRRRGAGRAATAGSSRSATLAGLGTDEDIQSVRWFDDLAVVVTFRQMDPLYTIDLTDPDPAASPRRAEDPGLLRLPAPDRRRPAARARQRRHPRRPEPRRPGGRLRHRRHHAGPPGRQGDLRLRQLVRGGRGPARVHLAARRSSVGDRQRCSGRQRAPHRPAAGRRRRLPVATRDLPASAAGASGRCPSRTVGWPSSASRSARRLVRASPVATRGVPSSHVPQHPHPPQLRAARHP